MPIYKYECQSCGHLFEDLRGFNDPDPEACPECEDDEIQRLISGGNFQLKGSGWYATDYGSSGASTDESTSSDEPVESTADGDEAA